MCEGKEEVSRPMETSFLSVSFSLKSGQVSFFVCSLYTEIYFQKGGVPFVLLDLRLKQASVELRQENAFGILPERRCSSRTFRYGYLVTT